MLSLPVLSKSRAGLSEIEGRYIAKSLLNTCPTINCRQTNIEVSKLLEDNPDIISVAVVEDDAKPIGLLNRNFYMEVMAKRFNHALFDRKSCTTFMDRDPLIVDENMSIQDLSFKVLDAGHKTLNDGFIITDSDGHYLGLGRGEDLVRFVAFLQAENHRLITESIEYASVIQKSFLRSSRTDMNEVLEDYFLCWRPRDKVGGDYYFCKKFTDGFFLALIDCTGHGVPGAFMTLIVASFLDHILLEDNRHDPAGALRIMNRKIKKALGQMASSVSDEKGHQSDDGMDSAFCWINSKEGKLVYAGAKIALYHINDTLPEVQMLEPDRKGIGYVDTPEDYTWSNQEIPLTKGECVYMTTDGLVDQIGGANKIAFGKKRFMALIRDNHHRPMSEQEGIIMDDFVRYQGTQQRRDDVCMIGFSY